MTFGFSVPFMNSTKHKGPKKAKGQKKRAQTARQNPI